MRYCETQLPAVLSTMREEILDDDRSNREDGARDSGGVRGVNGRSVKMRNGIASC